MSHHAAVTLTVRRIVADVLERSFSGTTPELTLSLRFPEWTDIHHRIKTELGVDLALDHTSVAVVADIVNGVNRAIRSEYA